MTTFDIATPQDFWDYVVVPDYDDSVTNVDDLRKAFHCAISLFHMADWIYITHQTTIHATFYFNSRKLLGSNVPMLVTRVSEFADSISDAHPNFELIRRIANSVKHLSLTGQSPHTNAPSNASNTSVQTTGYGVGGFGQGRYGGTPRVVLANHAGQPPIEFKDLATSVFNNWMNLKALHHW